MLDPDEGLNADGTIRTGASADRIRESFVAVLADVVEGVVARAPDASVYVYGSVATGRAVPPTSDVDLLTIGLVTADAAALSSTMSDRCADLCRGVEIGAGAEADFEGDRDEAYGNRVFLRHYCVHLSGPDLDRSTGPFAGDERAARGFNGDIGRHRDRWLAQAASVEPAILGRRIGRKALLAAAAIVSIHDSTWTTDRNTACGRLGAIDPSLADDLVELLAWSAADAEASRAGVERMLDGSIDALVRRFADEIGLWDD